MLVGTSTFIGGVRRGQALVETTLFLPLMLITLFSVIYFGRYGIIGERAQSAIRYGSMISYTQGGVYSIGGIYDAMNAGSQSSPSFCTGNVASDEAAALTQSVPNSGPTAQPYWNPDTAVTPTCGVTAVGFGGPDYMAFHYFTVTQQSLSAGVAVPTVLQALLGTTGTVRAQTGFAHSDPPGMIMYCSYQVGLTAAAALGYNYTPPNGNPCG